MARSQVIDQFRKKINSEGDYETFYLGPKQRYSEALFSSNNNNLEEQLLMGVDRVIRTWYDSETQTERKIIEFRRENDNSYYVLDVYLYDNGNIYEKDGVIYFSDENSEVEDGTLIYTDLENKLNYDAEQEILYITPDIITEQDRLYFKRDDGSNTLISVKNTTQSFENNAVVTKEVITNYV